ncbi:hypothetical protein PC116_g29755 [Phytophthora cactorum]|nr:hypothetical protein PC123_g27405 [Phytophthora cactorum]KAG4221769.1 hypothetical protein PC116_g29755 [Phytophthora cactorum]
MAGAAFLGRKVPSQSVWLPGLAACSRRIPYTRTGLVLRVSRAWVRGMQYTYRE